VSSRDGFGDSEKGAALVLGGSGVVGSYLTRELAQQGFDVTAADISEPFGLHRSLIADAPGAVIEQIDIGEGGALDDLLGRVRPRVVYNLVAAMQAQIDRSILDGVWVTVDLCGKVLDATLRHDVPLVVTMSSRAVYGPPVRERPDDVVVCRAMERASPVSSYGKMKHLLEAMVEWYWRKSSGRYCAVRTAIQWGLRDVRPGVRMFSLHNTVLETALRGERFEIGTRGEGPSDLISYLDLARGLTSASSAERFSVPVYNVGSGRTYRIEDLVVALADATGWDNFNVDPQTPFDRSLVSPTGLFYVLDIQETMVDWHWFPGRDLVGDAKEFARIWSGQQNHAGVG